MSRQVDMFGGKPKILRLQKMHVSDAGDVHGLFSVRYQCHKCGLETGWISERSISMTKRGIPCINCNQGKLKVLHLNLKRTWWEDINNGEKLYEYRTKTEYWRKRLVGKTYDYVFIKLGYPKTDETEKIIVFKYLGYKEIQVNHLEFGEKTDVYAINLTERVWGL